MGRDDPAPELARRSRAVGLAKAALVRGQVLAGTFRGGAPRPACASSTTTASRTTAIRSRSRRMPSGARWRRSRRAGSASSTSTRSTTCTLAPGEAAVALTFDDGYRDVLENALPVLREHGFPSTVFVVPGAIAARARSRWYAAGRDAAAGRLGRAAGRGAGGPRALRAAHAHAPGADRRSRATHARQRDRGLEGRRRARARPPGAHLLLPRAATTRRARWSLCASAACAPR